jgi:hypothetical protein
MYNFCSFSKSKRKFRIMPVKTLSPAGGSHTGTRRLMTALFLLLLSNILGCSNKPPQPLPSARQNPPVAGIREFEESAFCKQYKCKLETIVEVHGKESYQESPEIGWDYNYRIQRNNTVVFRISLSSKGDRQWPLFEIRWSPLKDKVVVRNDGSFQVRARTYAIHDEDFAFVPDLVSEIVGTKIPRTGAVYNCARTTCRVCPDMSAPCGTFAGKFDISSFLANYLHSICDGHNTAAYASISDLELQPTFFTITNKDESHYLELSLVIAKAAAANPSRSASLRRAGHPSTS